MNFAGAGRVPVSSETAGHGGPQRAGTPQLVRIDQVESVVSEAELDDILEGRAPFQFHFQPIVDLAHGITVGFEALARFSSGDVRRPPNLVFEAAGMYGRRFDLEELVLRQAIESRRRLPENCFLTVNVGPGFVLSDRMERLLGDFANLESVVIEITEDEAITNYPAIQKKLALIRSKGGLAAVDDAGSGYASLQHIMEIRPNFIKLDRAFVHGCSSDPAKSVLIEMFGKAANRLDAWIIAEGVETESELDELIRLGVPLAQGFYLARPHPAMQPLAEPTADRIASRIRSLASTTSLSRAVETPMVCADVEEAKGRLLEDRHCTLALILNVYQEPVMLIEKHPFLGIRSLPDFMKVQLASDPAEVLHRALTRASVFRYDPIVAINPLGQAEGVVHLDRLMRETLSPEP